MGIINVQSLLTKETISSEDIFVPAHLQGLFREYLKRYYEWKQMGRKELVWFFIVVILGFLNFMDLTGVIVMSFWIVLSFFFLFFIALHHYKEVKDKAAHAYLNFFILHHHFLGKLEVGFCNHTNECQCVEKFKKYVWTKYRISFNLLDP